MAITKLGDAQADYTAWKEVRKSYLSSSELFTWLGDVPDWWGDKPEDVLAGKKGVEKTFDRETETTIAHGSFDEANIQEKFGYAVGCNVRRDNGFYVNDRFPGIGASLDGWGCPVDGPCDTHPELCQDRTLVPYLRDYIDAAGTEFITEIKKSTSSKWQREVPEYYPTQVKTQLAVMEVDYAIIIAETFKRGREQKWRTFWDLRAYVIERDPKWDKVLEREGEKFLQLNKG